MNIIFYCPCNTEQGRNILGLLSRPVFRNTVRIYCSFHSLLKRLSRYDMPRALLVILTETMDELIEIYSIEHLLGEHILILGLPDKERETIAMGYRLRARFMGYLPDGSSEIQKALCGFLANPDHERRKNVWPHRAGMAVHGSRTAEFTEFPAITLDAA